MRQHLVNEIETAAYRAAPLQTETDAKAMREEKRIVVGEDVLEKRESVLAALDSRTLRRRLERTQRMLGGAVLALTFMAAIVLFLTLDVYTLRARLAQTEMPPFPAVSQTTVGQPVLSPPGVVPTAPGEPLQLIKLSALTERQSAFADFDTLTKVAKGRDPAETFVSETNPGRGSVPTANGTETDAPFWEIVRAGKGFNVRAYATPSSALAAANDGEATVYARPLGNAAPIQVPIARFRPDAIADVSAPLDNVGVLLRPATGFP